MFVFVGSSRRSWLHALPQDLRTRLFSVWFCTKHLFVALEGQGMPCEASPHITGRGLRPPAVVCVHRPYIWPTGTLFGRLAINFVKMAILSSRLLFICFFRYFRTAVWHLVPLHTRVWRDEPLVCLVAKLTRLPPL